jgi:alkylated DNA repair protein (DNA oxidative demethylase)
MPPDLFDALVADAPAHEAIGPGAALLRGHVLTLEEQVLAALHGITAAAPLRHLMTPGGFRMSAAMTNCGTVGWITDHTGYRYDERDPDSGQRWPAMPDAFLALAASAAAAAGYPDFVPDACLINRYIPGARLTPHQDRNERNFTQPIVSVSLGLPAIFQFGGVQRSDPMRRLTLRHGDVVVWGGESRLAYHGVLALKDGTHPRLGGMRFNLTFRKAL